MRQGTIKRVFLLCLCVWLSWGQIVNGCARYFTNNFLETKCIVCSAGLFLSRANTCQTCPDGQTFIGGGCTPTPGGSDSATNTNTFQRSGGPNARTTTIGTNSFNTLNRNTPAVVIPQQATQSTGTAGSTNPTNTGAIPQNPNPAASPAQSSIRSTSVRDNCNQYLQLEAKCLVCTFNFKLDANGFCVEFKFQQNNQFINPLQFYAQTAPPATPTTPTITTTTTTPAPSGGWGSFSNSGHDFYSFGDTTPPPNLSQPIQPTDTPETPVIVNDQKSLAPKQENTPTTPISTDSANNNANANPKINTNPNIEAGIKPNANTNVNTNTNSNSNSNTNTNTNTNTNINTNTNSNNKAEETHKFPQYPYCFDYDAGRCWACVPGYLLNLVVDKCVPYVKPATPNLAPAEEDKPTPPKNQNPSDNCNIFNESDQICDECLRNYFLSKNTRLCEPVDPLCRTYDPDSGDCLTCYAKHKLNAGKCIPS